MRRTAIALAAVVLTGCGGSPPSRVGASSSSAVRRRAQAAAEVPAVPGIEAEIVRLRTDEAIGGQVQVRVSDTGDTPFTVTAWRSGRPASRPSRRRRSPPGSCPGG